MSRKKVAVSACLLGEMCRYDGTTKAAEGVIKALEGVEIIPFCPEAPVLGTPRERISVICVDADCRVIGDESGRDVTELLRKQTQLLIDGHPDLDMIVLKSKSPSCGLGTTPLLGASREPLGFGNGVAAKMLTKAFPCIDVVDEETFAT